MRRGYDLPPLNFDTEEIEALRVGLLLLTRTGDSTLQKAATRIFEKMDVLHGPADWLQVTSWGVHNLMIRSWAAYQSPCCVNYGWRLTVVMSLIGKFLEVKAMA